MSTTEKVLVITTGGTIDKVYFDALSAFQVGEPAVTRLLHMAHVTQPFEVQELLRKDSLELTDEDRAHLHEQIAAAPAERIVITHGTDTMTTTAKVLASIPHKTIVLTGSLSPARFQDSDAPFNLGMAFAAVQTCPPGVYIAMNGQVFRGDEVVKDRSRAEFVRAARSKP